jgi:hypothetical protein|tara:strand:+ start:1223 stop:1372 length:150 start_codon:yes stop_codon:yes gene_type:complete
MVGYLDAIAEMRTFPQCENSAIGDEFEGFATSKIRTCELLITVHIYLYY